VSNAILWVDVDKTEVEDHELEAIIENYYFAIEN